MENLSRWWDKYPERYRREIQSFNEAGIECDRNEDVFSKGKLVLNIRFPLEGQLFDLTIKYPDTYPFFRPKVIAPTLNLPYHQNPVDKNLCLLDQPTDSWDQEETVYQLLLQQFHKVLAAGGTLDRASVAELETHQAEPRSEYCKYKAGSCLLIDGSWIPHVGIDRGFFVIGVEPNIQVKDSIVKVLRGAVLELQNEAGSTLFTALEGINLYYSSNHKIKGHWVRLPSAPDIVDEHGLLDFIKIHCQKEAKYIEKRISNGGEGVIGFLFPEEKGWNKEKGVGWMFLAFHGKKKSHSPPVIFSYLVKAERSGAGDLRERIPELHPLQSKKIAVVGCGCVGAPSVIEFAKCGIGEIRLWDGDSVSPGNSCRWPLGVPFARWTKVDALSAFIKGHYPQTSIGLRAGFKLGEPDADEAVAVQRMFEGVDLIFDATAERGVQLFLSSKACDLGIPYVMAESRPGGWGGLIAKILPGGDNGCYYCLLHALTDESIKPPPAKEEDFIQPQGCISPTFTAASFDTSSISMAAVRLAISTLIANQSGGYPSIEHNVGILSLRDPSTGLATFPNWKTYSLGKHPNCHCKD